MYEKTIFRIIKRPELGLVFPMGNPSTYEAEAERLIVKI